MSYFNYATMVISEECAHGDYELPADEFRRDDRWKRIDSAASSLCDWAFEYLLETEGFEGFRENPGTFKHEHLPRICKMLAIAMMAQFEHDQEMESRLIESSGIIAAIALRQCTGG